MIQAEILETSDSQYAVQPFFFGETSRELFGCYHRPKRVPARDCGIVLCQPLGQEYIFSHRSIYQLAVQLARVGFHVLRFDYLGCGDAADDFERCSLPQWCRDIRTAAGALADRSGHSCISLLGLRMGATLSIMAAQEDAFGTLMLWEPVLDGRRYLMELDEIQKSFAQQLKNSTTRVLGMPGEVLGFPLTNALRQDLEAIQPDRLRLHPGIRLLTVSNSDGARSEELNRFLQDHPHAENQTIGDHRVWREELYKRLIPATTLNFLVNWIDKIYP